MEISRNSWHYRLCNFALGLHSKEPSSSLCKYFWQVLFSPVLITMFFVFWAFVIALVLVVLFYVPGSIANTLLCNLLGILPDSFSVDLETFNYRSVLSSVVVIIGAFICSWIDDKNKERAAAGQPDGLVKSFIKAKKEKICPVLEFKD